MIVGSSDVSDLSGLLSGKIAVLESVLSSEEVLADAEASEVALVKKLDLFTRGPRPVFDVFDTFKGHTSCALQGT